MLKNWLQLIAVILLLTNGVLLSADDIDIYPKQRMPNVLLVVNASNKLHSKQSLKTILDNFYQTRRPVTIGLMTSDSEHLAHRLVDISKNSNLESLKTAVDYIKPDQANVSLETLLQKAVKIFPEQNSVCSENHIIILNDQSSLSKDTKPNNIKIHRIDLGQTNNSQKTSSVINDIFKSTTKTIDTLTTPVIAVNAYNNLQHRSDIYFALFQPSASSRWAGNIKKYQLANGKIVDANGANAIRQDKNAGYFNDSALSFWTSITDWNPDDGDNTATVDGNHIDYGGYGYRLDSPSTRKIYTYLNDFTPNNEALATERLTKDNTKITAELLGLKSAEVDKRNVVLNWTQGYQMSDNPSPNYFVADFIHNRPAVVSYRTLNADKEQFDDTLFSGSNRGLFHAIDAASGNPIFSFIPKQLLPNLTSYYQNTPNPLNKTYGLDASMTVWRHDSNGNGSVVSSFGGIDIPETDDHVYIYQAMRRGGNSLFALDVSARQQPKLMWQINGKKDLDHDGHSDASPGFTDLGQTWSRPQLTTLRWNCTDGITGCQDKKVIFFAGGYDSKHDHLDLSHSDQGNAIYMVDAISGKLLWSAGKHGHDLELDNMHFSIPADVTVADINGDNYADVLFAIDIMGQLWRFDLNQQTNNKDDFAKGTTGAMIANLGGDNRHFYNAADIAYIRLRGQTPFLSIAVGSGYRPQPDNTTIKDRFFVVFDHHPLTPPANYNYVGTRVITASDMAAVTVNPRLHTRSRANQYGWYLNMDSANGEKILSSSVSFNHQLLFTTYIPSRQNNNCTNSRREIGTARYYIVNLLKGHSVLSISGNRQAYKELQRQGIPTQPSIIFTTENNCIANCNTSNPSLSKQDKLIVCIGTECINDTVDLSLHKTYWREY